MLSSEDSTTNYAWETEINGVLSTEDSTRTGRGSREDFENILGLLSTEDSTAIHAGKMKSIKMEITDVRSTDSTAACQG